MMKKLLLGVVGSVLMGLSLQALAHEKGDFIVRVGAAAVDPNENSSDVSVGYVPVANSHVGLDSNTQLGITATYMLTNNLGIGVLAASPFEHEVSLGGSLSGLTGKVGSVRHLPPTVTLQYFFNNESAFTPYIGAGINYTYIFDEHVTDDLEYALGQGLDMNATESFGIALEAGFDFDLTENLVLSGQVWYLDIDTEASIKGNAGARIDVDIDLDPMVYMVGIGYKF